MPVLFDSRIVDQSLGLVAQLVRAFGLHPKGPWFESRQAHHISMSPKNPQNVRSYYNNPETRYGFKLITKDAQHFGYYPNINDNITENQAQKELHKLLANHLELSRHKNIFDAGCGRGVVAADLASSYNISITGIDITPYIVEKAKERVRSGGLEEKVKILEGDYTQTQFPDDSFDAVYAVETLSHLPDLEKGLREFHRILKQGGLGVFIEYEIAPFNQFSQYEFEMYRLVRDGSAMNALDQFVEGNFVKMLGSAGFRVLEDINITKNRSKSMKRLHDIAYVPYQFIKLLGLRKFFINTTAGVEFYLLNEKNLFRYHLYKVLKPRA